MMNLNELSKISLADAEKRETNSGHIKTDTRSMLKHCATEVIEAMEAWTEFSDIDDSYSSIKSRERAKDSFASELADIINCCLIMAGTNGIDLNKAVADCLEKNHKRAEKIGDKL